MHGVPYRLRGLQQKAASKGSNSEHLATQIKDEEQRLRNLMGLPNIDGQRITPTNAVNPPAFGKSQRVLNVSQVIKEGRTWNESEEVVVVRFRVAHARTMEYDRGNGEEQWWVLCSEKPPYDDHPLAFTVNVAPKALDELKKNGIEDIAKHFVGKIFDFEGPISVMNEPCLLKEELLFQWDIPREFKEYPYYSTEVNTLEQIQEAKAVSPPMIDSSKTLDREDVRRVVEVYIAAALQGDHTTAASVAIVQGKPADPKQIEQQILAISRSLNLKQLAMQSIYLNDCEHPTGALAISESVTHAEKQRNGERTGSVIRSRSTCRRWINC
jgi:hypothetical protein